MWKREFLLTIALLLAADCWANGQQSMLSQTIAKAKYGMYELRHSING